MIDLLTAHTLPNWAVLVVIAIAAAVGVARIAG